jgi:Xaa-Pro aminopeptidase
MKATHLQGELSGKMDWVSINFAKFHNSETSSDYRHGTGHGVGHFLNVHEGPQGIGKRITQNDTFIKAGMTLSNGTNNYL